MLLRSDLLKDVHLLGVTLVIFLAHSVFLRPLSENTLNEVSVHTL